MKRLATFVLLLVLLPATATALVVTPAAVTTSEGTVLVQWQEDAHASLRLQAKHISGSLMDTVKEDRIDNRGTPLPNLENATGNGGTYQQALPNGAGHVSLVRSGAATIIIQPISDDFRTSYSTKGDVVLRSVDEEVLESNHAYDDPDAELDAPDNYVYRVHDVVAAGSKDQTTLRIDGDFLLYVWDATVLQETSDTAHTHFTGVWKENGRAPGLQDIHYQHALFVVRGGHLRMEAPEGATVYAPQLALHATAGNDGPLGFTASTDPILATIDGDRVALTQAAVPATPGLGIPANSLTLWWLPASALVLLALAVAPNIIGRDHANLGNLLDRLCAARAQGFRKLSLNAERRHQLGLAAHWMGRAAHWDTDPELRMQQGIYLRLADRPRRALRIHHIADQAFRATGITHALNSYEAARAAARTGRLDEAIQWLLSAVQEETWLARKAPFEPDLAPLRRRPEFMDLRFAADPDGLLRP